MKLTWYGTAAMMLESEHCRLVFDPFLGMPLRENPERRERLAEAFRRADAVLVTHGHFDHIHDLPYLYSDADVPIYATATPCATLSAHGAGEELLHRIEPGDRFELGNFQISVYQGRHCRFDFSVVMKTVFKRTTVRHPLRLLRMLRLNRRYPESGETLFYEIEAEGKRIQLMGSMGMDDTQEYPTGADALVLPFQGTGNPAKTVTPIVERLRPRSIFLDHYDDAFPPMSSAVNTARFVRGMTERGISCIATEQETTYII